MSAPGSGAALIAERALSNTSPNGGRSSSGDLKGQQAGPVAGSTPISLTLSPHSTPVHFMIQCEVLGDAEAPAAAAAAGAAGGNKKASKPMSLSETAIYLLSTIRCASAAVYGVLAMLRCTARVHAPDDVTTLSSTTHAVAWQMSVCGHTCLQQPSAFLSKIEHPQLRVMHPVSCQPTCT